MPTPVTMRVGAVQISGDNYRLQIHTCLEEGADPVTVRTYAVIVEDHYPSTPTYSRNSFRLATDTADFTLQPGTCRWETRDVTLTATWLKANLGIIAWAQTPGTHAPAEVFQAAKDLWPWSAVLVPGDLNCDGLIDFSDINPFVQALSDPVGYQAEFPTCNLLNGDCNADGAVDFNDVNDFVELLAG